MKYVKLEIFWCKNVLPNIFVMCQRFTDITVIFQPAEQTDKMHIFFLWDAPYFRSGESVFLH